MVGWHAGILLRQAEVVTLFIGIPTWTGALALVAVSMGAFVCETTLFSMGWPLGFKPLSMRWFWAIGILTVPWIGIPGYLIHLGIAGWKVRGAK